MTVVREVAGYELDDDPARVDRDVVWQFLSTQAYWGTWRDRSVVEHQIAGAWRVVGAYTGPVGEMVGFARAVSDGVALAYLADVFVEPAHRRRGLGSALVAAIIDDGPGADSTPGSASADLTTRTSNGRVADGATGRARAGGRPRCAATPRRYPR